MGDTRKYAASFVLDMRGCTDTVDTVIGKLSSVITSLGGEISATENLGQKRFERKIDRSFPSGVYVQILFAGAPKIVDGIKSKLRLDKTINRVLVESVR
ncbi:MAG: 30S ribosomal protein S6 [Puniceicoccales bacterium]|jgi:ribosomal protein S6|nr:30S ribosomal protein S6 [Puniceicoccales bacterium]